MPNASEDFLADWISENINAESYEPEGDDSRAQELAQQCQNDGQQVGFSRIDLDRAGGGNLVAFIASALKRATDDEVARLAARDD